eukprot:1837418-Rhodomonas_salina.1
MKSTKNFGHVQQFYSEVGDMQLHPFIPNDSICRLTVPEYNVIVTNNNTFRSVGPPQAWICVMNTSPTPAYSDAVGDCSDTDMS